MERFYNLGLGWFFFVLCVTVNFKNFLFHYCKGKT